VPCSLDCVQIRGFLKTVGDTLEQSARPLTLGASPIAGMVRKIGINAYAQNPKIKSQLRGPLYTSTVALLRDGASALRSVLPQSSKGVVGAMLKTIFKRVMWLARGTSMVLGLALMLALVMGVATMALAAVPGDPFKLGKTNTINKLSKLVGSVAGPMLSIDNNGNGPALDLQVEQDKPP
jgi:hypothetical protein